VAGESTLLPPCNTMHYRVAIVVAPARRRGATRAPALAAARQQGMRLAQVAEQLRLGARELADPGR
jgi:hypothetical protein